MQRVNKNRLGKFLPKMEVLENRWQPGSLLTSGLDLAALGSTLDQNLGSANGSQATNPALSLDLSRLHTSQASGGTVVTTPYQVSHSNNAANTSLTLASGSATQGFENTQAMAGAASHVGSTQHVATQSAGTQAASSNSHQQGGAQVNQSNIAFSAVTAQVAGVVSAVRTVAPVSVQSGSLKLTTTAVNNNQHAPLTGFWASLANNPASAGHDNAELVRLAQVGGGANATLYAVGDVTDASTGSQDAAILLTQAGSTSALIATVGSPTGDAKALGVAIDSTGNVLVVGTYADPTSGAQDGFVASIAPDLSAINWSHVYSSTNGPLSMNGVADPNGTVYVTGSAIDSSSQQDVLVATYDEAGNAIVGPFIYGFSQPTTGNGIGVDVNTGNIDVAGSFGAQPSFFQLPPDGSSASGAFFASPGAFTGVQVDASGNAYYTGPFQNPTAGVVSDLVAKVNPDGATLSADYSGSGWFWTVTFGGVPGNWVAGNNVIDVSGDQGMETTVDDNSGMPNTHGQLYFEVGPTGQTVVEFDFTTVSGSNDDYGYGAATDGVGNIYTTGKTDSTDFGPTNGFKTSYSSGDVNEGWILYATSP